MKKKAGSAISRALLAGMISAAIGPALFGQIAVTLKTTDDNPVAGGLFFQYNITATNLGATGPMTLNDFLDPGIQFLSVSSTASSAAAKVICSGPAIGSSGSITCSSPSFPAGGVANITILAQCAPNITGVRQNIADAIPLGPPFPERASVLQRIQNNAGLQLFMTATPVVLAGDTVVYNIQVLDDGASSALGVLVEDQLPGSTSFVSATGTGNFQNACSFKPATNKVQCFASELTTGVAEITIVAKSSDVKKPDGLSNTATLRASTPLVTNSQVSVSTTVLTK